MFKRPRHLTIIPNYPAGPNDPNLQERLPKLTNETNVSKKEAVRRAKLAVETVALAFEKAILIVGDEQAHDLNRKVTDKNGHLLLMVQVWK